MDLERLVLASACVLVVCVELPIAAGKVLYPGCELAIHEERVELEDARLDVQLARSTFAAFEKIFGLIDRLWQSEATQRMTFLRAKYDRDAARLDLERADLLLQRQQALVDFYRFSCDAGSDSQGARKEGESLSKIRERYRRADCDQQAKAAEVAQVNLEFNREWLASVRDLRAGDVATVQDLIQAELDVKLEEQRLADARRRAEGCLEESAPGDEAAPGDG